MTVTRRSADAVLACDRSDWTVDGLIRAAEHFDVDAVTEAVWTSVADHGVLWTWEQLIHPVWVGLGGGRDDTDAPVVAEHLFSRAIAEMLTAAQRPLGRGPAQVLLACADGEHHTLALDALAAALAESGVRTCVLGARVPPHALAAAAARLRPAVVIIWSQVRGTADPGQISSLLTACPGPSMITAGPGWDRAALPGPAMTAPGVFAALRTTAALLNETARSVA